jgi:hypothetical protein
MGYSNHASLNPSAISRSDPAMILWKSSDSLMGAINNYRDQVLDNDGRFDSIFCANNLNGQDWICLLLGHDCMAIRFCMLIDCIFNLFCQVIIFRIGFMLPVPFFTLSSVKFFAALRPAGSLPSFLPYIRHKPFSANTAGTLST